MLIEPVSVRDSVLLDVEASVADSDPVSVTLMALKTVLVSTADSVPVSATATAVFTTTLEVSRPDREPVSFADWLI